MRLLCASLLAASAAFAAPSVEEITPTKKVPFLQPAEADRAQLHTAIKTYMAKEPSTRALSAFEAPKTEPTPAWPEPSTTTMSLP